MRQIYLNDYDTLNGINGNTWWINKFICELKSVHFQGILSSAVFTSHVTLREHAVRHFSNSRIPKSSRASDHLNGAAGLLRPIWQLHLHLIPSHYDCTRMLSFNSSFTYLRRFAHCKPLQVTFFLNSFVHVVCTSILKSREKVHI